MNRIDEIRRLSMKWNDAWNSGQAEQLEAFFLPGSTYYDPTFPDGPAPGREGVRACALKTWADWPRVNFEAVSIIVEGEHAALEWRTTAQHRSGVAIRLEGVDLLEWEGQGLRWARTYFDVSLRRAALGEAAR